MEFIVGRSFTKQGKQHLQANDKLYEGMELHKKTSGSPLNIEIIKQTHKIMMHKEKHRDGKDVLDIETRLHSQAIIFLHRLILLEDIWKTQFLGFMKLKKMIQSWPLQICCDTSIYIHLKMETEEFVP